MTSLPAFEIGILLLLSWEGFHVVFHRDMKALYPKEWLILTSIALTWVLLLLALFVEFPIALHWLLACLVGLRARRYWRDRPQAGLPPGSRSLASSLRALPEIDFYQERAKQLGPIFKMAQFHQSTICITDLELGHGILSGHRNSLEPCPLPFNHQLCGGLLRYMDADTYKRYGPLFRKALSREVLLVGEEVRDLACSQLERVALGKIPLQNALEKVTFEAFLMALMGFDSHHPSHSEFLATYRRFARQGYGERAKPETLAALTQLCEFARTLQGQTRAKNALNELRRLNPKMPDQVCYENIMYILRLSAANVVELLQWLMEVLAENPIWQEKIRRRKQGSDLVERIILETLRLHQSEYLYRRIAETFEVNGYRFPKGWLLRICIRECHRDPQVFEAPRKFNPDRFLVRPTIDEYSPFGFLDHACNGVPLNHSICRTFLEEMADKFSLRMVKKGRPVRGFRHWSHWRPSSIVSLSPISTESSLPTPTEITLQ